MEFTARVELRDPVGRLLKSIPCRQAKLLFHHGRVTVLERRRDLRVRSVQLCGERPVKIGLPTPLSLANYMGQRYTRRDESHAVALKLIREEDGDLFCLAVTDCLV